MLILHVGLQGVEPLLCINYVPEQRLIEYSAAYKPDIIHPQIVQVRPIHRRVLERTELSEGITDNVKQSISCRFASSHGLVSQYTPVAFRRNWRRVISFHGSVF